MRLRMRQIAAIMRIDLAKTFFSKRGLWIYLLALAPAVPMLLHGIVGRGAPGDSDFGDDVRIFAGIFQFFYLRIAVFFGCVGIFVNLIRGEMLDKSLHYYLLAPVRREVLLLGKFLSGLAAAVTIFTGAVVVQFAAMFWHHSPELLRAYLFRGPGLSHLASYMAATALACVGYGSVFLAAGTLFRNPVLTAAAIEVWESMNGILPAFLKKISVIYWLKSVCPVSIGLPKTGKNDILNLLIFDIDPAPAAVAIVNVLLLAAFLLAWASMRARRLEIGYGSE